MDITAKHDSGSLGIVIPHNVETIVRDGTVLSSNVYRPNDGARYPGLLTRTPYCKDQEGLGLARYAAYVRAGYAVVVQDSRGRYESDGDFIPQYVADTGDAEDGYDSVEWLAAQDYCNGAAGKACQVPTPTGKRTGSGRSSRIRHCVCGTSTRDMRSSPCPTSTSPAGSITASVPSGT